MLVEWINRKMDFIKHITCGHKQIPNAICKQRALTPLLTIPDLTISINLQRYSSALST